MEFIYLEEGRLYKVAVIWHAFQSEDATMGLFNAGISLPQTDCELDSIFIHYQGFYISKSK